MQYAFLPRILVVDDEVFILRMVERMLSEAGYEVLTARGGDDAIAIVKQRGHELSLVLTDVVMPDLDGIAVAQACRTAVPRIPVLLMSAFGIVNTAGLPIIAKPFTSKGLTETVRSVLRAPKKPSRQEHQMAAQITAG